MARNFTKDEVIVMGRDKKEKKEILPTKFYVADFETTVYKGQKDTQVWAAALVDLDAPDDVDSVTVFHSISSFMWRLKELSAERHIVVYFHNLRFDGSFIMNFLKNSKYWKEDSYELQEDGVNKGLVLNENGPYKMKNGFYRYSISEKGQWYSISLKSSGHLIEIRDSLKLLPFSVSQLGKGFGLKHHKLDMEYTGYRYPGCKITPEEREYIANDVLVVKEALNYMFAQGHDGLTIGSCCLDEFKKKWTKEAYAALFPNLYEHAIDGLSISAGEWLRKTYKGGWCYVVPEKAGKEYRKLGTTCDVNSLYPSMQVSQSGNYYCVGFPNYWRGDFIPEEAHEGHRYYFVHVRTRFYIKEGMLPTIQIKGSLWYPGREWLKSSDVINMNLPKSQRYDYKNRSRWMIEAGEIKPALADLYLTQTDWEMLQDHYTLEDTEIIDGMWFETEIGLFDEYIWKYANQKINAKTKAERQEAKLFANNLYGKMSASPDSSYRIEFLNDKGELRGYTVPGYDKTPGYIPIGSQITSYARRFTITAAQLNYHGPDQPGFIYADTDSIHCDLSPDEIKGCPEHPTDLLAWKYETCWDYAKFIRAKTYVEHVTHENRDEIDKPYYNMKCAGMSDHVKTLFLHSVEQDITKEEFDKLDEDEQEFVKEQRTFDDFDIGLEIPGMLKARNIKGGTLLVKGNYKMHKTIGD